MTVRFTVPGEPKGKGRPRFAKRGNYVKTYTPDETAVYENLVTMCYKSSAHGAFFDSGVPICVVVDAFFSIPASVSKKKRQEMLWNNIRPTKKPDCDNIGKVVYDALNKIAFYDDSQIVIGLVRKFFSDTPRLEVEISTTDEDGFVKASQ